MALSETELALWNQIDEFSLDDDTASFSFTKRLARDNNWGLAFADRVASEYKKFMFLAVVADHTVTPSDQIDQAWHLHLIYTQSYWQDFCDGVLGKPVHHGPTRGGKQEQGKFIDLYELTKQTYYEKFDEYPPVDIWPESKKRFEKDSYNVWVNNKDYWVIRKPDFSKLISSETLPLASAAILPALLLAWSPYDLPGKSFLIFYGVLALCAAVLTIVLQRVFTTDGSEDWQSVRNKKSLPANHLAYLAGGETQLLQSSLCELMVSGHAKSLRQQLQPTAGVKSDAKLSKVSKAIYSKLQTTADLNYSEIKSATKLPIAKISGELAKAGLIQSRMKRHILAWMSVIVMGGVIAIGIGRLIQAAGTGRPVGFLLLEMMLVCVAAAMLVAAVPVRTKTGNEILAAEKSKIEKLKSKTIDNDSSSHEIAMMVGLLGTSVLAGTVWNSFHKEVGHVLSPTIHTGGGGGGDSFGCSTGCGGGGCGGGCGGCGG